MGVAEVLDRWLGPLHRDFKVAANKGRKDVLRHDTASGDRELTALVEGRIEAA